MKSFTRAAYWRWLQLPETHATKSSTQLFNPFNSRFGGLFWIDAKIKFDTLATQKTHAGFEATTITNTQHQ